MQTYSLRYGSGLALPEAWFAARPGGFAVGIGCRLNLDTDEITAGGQDILFGADHIASLEYTHHYSVAGG